MAKEVTDSQVIKVIKKLGVEAAISAYAEELGVPTGSIGPTIWRLEPEADSSLRFKGNKSEIVRARKSGMRWERIAARTGLSKAEAQRIGGKDADVYTGRGRRFDGSAPAGKKATSGRRGRPPKATSGRRAKASGGKQAGRRAGRAKTRAEAQAGRRSPS